MTIPHITEEQASVIFIVSEYPLVMMDSYNQLIDKANAQPEPVKLKCGGGHVGSDYCSWCGGAMWMNVPEVCPVRARDSLQKQKENMEVLVFGCQLESPSTQTCEKWCGLNNCPVSFKEKPEPVDPHAALRAEYAKQVAEGTTEFYLWEYKNPVYDFWQTCVVDPNWNPDNKYRCTDISCYVSRNGEPAIRMLRTEAKELQIKLGESFEWHLEHGMCKDAYSAKNLLKFIADGTYTYRTKATIKLNGEMVTREQAMADWEAKKETHICIHFDFGHQVEIMRPAFDSLAINGEEYELRPKPAKVVWTGSREDVIALLKELGLL